MRYPAQTRDRAVLREDVMNIIAQSRCTECGQPFSFSKSSLKIQLIESFPTFAHYFGWTAPKETPKFGYCNSCYMPIEIEFKIKLSGYELY
jgi:hypothetical protein